MTIRSRLRGTTPVSQWLGAGSQLRVKSIQRGTITITGATSNTATISTVDPANSRLRHLGQTYDTSSVRADRARVRLALTNATTITATVNTSPGAEAVTVSYEILELYPGAIKSVQRGTISGAATATIAEVNTAKSELDFLGYTTAAIDGDMVYTVKQVLTNGTTVTQTEGVAQTNVGGYQVVEWF